MRSWLVTNSGRLPVIRQRWFLADQERRHEQADTDQDDADGL
jgi:hypothetical protein